MKWFFKMGVATALTVSMTTTAFAQMQINANDWAIPSMEKAYELDQIGGRHTYISCGWVKLNAP